MKVNIDSNSGFCYGVVCAIEMAEKELLKGNQLYCLGDIVHNSKEVERLKKLGLITINHDEFKKLKNCRVLIRTHGEPPETYRIAKQSNIELVDASCPVVLKLQEKIRKEFETGSNDNNQIVIYGKKGHAEVTGLVGQANGKVLVVESIGDLSLINFEKPIALFSQTTKSLKNYKLIKEEISKRIQQKGGSATLTAYNTICGQVANRKPHLKKFAESHDVVLFVSGKNSSNGNMLFNYCKNINPRTYFVSDTGEITPDMIKNANLVGICGATSTPGWQMEDVQKYIMQLTN